MNTMAEEPILKQEELYNDEHYREMTEAGVFYGRKKSKTHPRMKRFILGNRNGLEIINLINTKEMLDAALIAIKQKVQDGGMLFFVGTQPPAEDVKPLAAEFNYPFVVRRWLGGTLTNCKIILGRIEYYKKLKSDLAKGALDRYTKKERVGMEKELAKMEEVMNGLETFTGLPGMLVVIDANLHMTAVREARHLRIPVVALANTDTDPDLINYPVLGNNKAKTSVNWFLNKVKGAVEEGIAARPVKPVAETKEINKETSNAGKV